MPPKLSTHVLDTASGKPGSGIRVQLFRDSTLLTDSTTNASGRCDAPLLEGDAMLPGPYQLLFHIGEYFRAQNIPCPFLDIVPVHFQIEAGQSYHIPLGCAPWAYSTYRGS
jgi:5-hydroxyisourate hydrolase